MFEEFLNSQRSIVELALELALFFILVQASIKFFEVSFMSERKTFAEIVEMEREIEFNSKFSVFVFQHFAGEHLNIVNYKFNDEEKLYVSSKIRENLEEFYNSTDSRKTEIVNRVFSETLQWLREREARRVSEQ
jgi:hypothetical protein